MMYKKIICLAMLVCLALAPGLASHGESGIKLQHGKNTYTIKQASLPKSGFPFSVSDEDDTVILFDKNTGITAEVDIAVMSKDSVKALRSYYNDETADKDKLFSNLLTLYESYIDAALESSKTNFLYGNGGEPGTEINMKLFSKTTSKLFKQDSDIFIYNTIESSKTTYNEQTHIDIFVPIRSSYTIVNVNFTLKAGGLTKKNIGIINQMLGSIRITGLTAQSGSLQILKNSTLLASINSGIYPNSTITPSTPVNSLVEPESGFRLKYPASLSQYMQNNLIKGYYYNSFKISPNEVFSITVEPSVLSEAAISEHKIHDYTLAEKNTTTYIKDYLLINDGYFYKLQLKSFSKKPSAFALKTFTLITDSFEFISPKSAEIAVKSDTNSIYLDKATGLSFLYPSGWRLSNAPTPGGLKLNIPDISDSLDIYIVKSNLDNAPYKKLQAKLLLNSYRFDGEAGYTYRLVNYIDEYSSGKLCSSVTLSKGAKTYTMYVDVNSNWVRGGKISDAKVAIIVNAIIDSFRIDEDPNIIIKGYDDNVTPLKSLPQSGYVFSCS